jgi:hypothetical protein
MTTLTPTEKQSWHDRLAVIIDRALARLAADDPGLPRRLRREARRRAWQSLGLAELQAERAALAAQQRALAARRRRLHRAMLAVVRRVPVDQVADAADRLPAEVVRAVRRRRAAHQEELLAAAGATAAGLRPTARRTCWKRPPAGTAVSAGPTCRGGWRHRPPRPPARM